MYKLELWYFDDVHEINSYPNYKSFAAAYWAAVRNNKVKNYEVM